MPQPGRPTATPDTATPPVESSAPASPPGLALVDDQAPEPTVAASSAKPASPDDPIRAELRRFVEAFGREAGATWYLEGLSFEAAQAKHTAALAAENAELKRKFAAAGEASGEDEPVPLSAIGDDRLEAAADE